MGPSQYNVVNPTMNHPQFYQKCAGLPKSKVYDIVLGLPQHSVLLYIYPDKCPKKEIPIFQCFNPHFGWYFPIFSHIFVASFPPIVPYLHISRDISRKTCPPNISSRAASRGRHGKKGSFRGITLEELIPVFLKAHIYIHIYIGTSNYGNYTNYMHIFIYLYIYIFIYLYNYILIYLYIYILIYLYYMILYDMIWY
jgi:hypothetical protein